MCCLFFPEDSVWAARLTQPVFIHPQVDGERENYTEIGETEDLDGCALSLLVLNIVLIISVLEKVGC